MKPTSTTTTKAASLAAPALAFKLSRPLSPEQREQIADLRKDLADRLAEIDAPDAAVTDAEEQLVAAKAVCEEHAAKVAMNAKGKNLYLAMEPQEKALIPHLELFISNASIELKQTCMRAGTAVRDLYNYLRQISVADLRAQLTSVIEPRLKPLFSDPQLLAKTVTSSDPWKALCHHFEFGILAIYCFTSPELTRERAHWLLALTDVYLNEGVVWKYDGAKSVPVVQKTAEEAEE